jgi:large subunit ribosomal protein L30
MAKLKITQVKSRIGNREKMVKTLEALGLKRVNQSVEHEDNPQIRGMVRVVNHLVRVEEVK